MDLLTSAKFVLASDDSHVRSGGQILGRGFGGLHVASFAVPVRVREMRGCRIVAVVQESLEIRVIIIMLARLCESDTIQGVVTLTEQRVEEIIGYSHVVCKVHILPEPEKILPRA